MYLNKMFYTLKLFAYTLKNINVNDKKQTTGLKKHITTDDTQRNQDTGTEVK
jgi:hypothetical protein